MNLRLERKSTWYLHRHVCMDECSCTLVSRIFLPTRLCAHFLPLPMYSQVRPKPSPLHVPSFPSLDIIPYLTRIDLDYLTPSYHKPSPSDPVSRAPTESVSTTSPAIPEPKVSDDETFPSYGPFFWEISRLSLTLL